MNRAVIASSRPLNCSSPESFESITLRAAVRKSIRVFVVPPVLSPVVIDVVLPSQALVQKTKAEYLPRALLA